MPYPRKLINEGETVVLDLKPHWWFFARQIGVGVLLFVLLIFVWRAFDGSVEDASFAVVAIAALAWAVWLALAFFDCAGVRLMLSLPERPSFDHPSSVLYFTVEDLRMAYRTLAARGVPFIDEPHLIAKMPDHELWMAFFTDTEGNTHGLMSEVR